MTMLPTDVEAMTKRFTDYEERIQTLEEELAREKDDSDLFLQSLAARDQEVAVLCATAKKVISLFRHRGDREMMAALKNLQVAIDMAQNEVVVDRGK